MKTNQIPDLYLEQYLLGDLPENLREELDDLILKNPELGERISRLKKSDEDILFTYPAESIASSILKKSESRQRCASDAAAAKNMSQTGINFSLTRSLKKIAGQISLISSRRYTLSLASAALMLLVLIFTVPGIRNTFMNGSVIDNDVRIKGLDSKLILYRVKGKDVEELKNLDTAGRGDIIQVGYIASGDYKYGVILSIDGRGVVTKHLPDSNKSGTELVLNRRTLLNKSYELDDSPSFERFFMILSTDPINTSEITEKAKKLALSGANAVNGSIEAGKNSVEFSITLKKHE